MPRNKRTSSATRENNRDRMRRHRSSPSKSELIKEKDKLRKRSHRSSPSKSELIKEQDKLRKLRHRSSPSKSELIKEQDKLRKRQHRRSPSKSELIKEHDRLRKRQQRNSHSTSDQIKENNRNRMRRSRNSPSKSDVLKERDRYRKRRHRSSPSKSELIKEQDRLRKQIHRSSPSKSELIKEQDRLRKRGQRSSPSKSEVLKEQDRYRKRRNRRSPSKSGTIKEKESQRKRNRRSNAHHKIKAQERNHRYKQRQWLSTNGLENITYNGSGISIENVTLGFVNSNINTAIETELNNPHYLGRMDAVCEFCAAVHFLQERPTDRKFSKCCHKGKVRLPQYQRPPQFLQDLYNYTNNQLSAHFFTNIRKFNNAFAMASMGAKVVDLPGAGPFCFKIHGSTYHITSNLQAEGTPRFAQLYILDPSEALEERVAGIAAMSRNQAERNEDRNRQIITQIQDILYEINPFVRSYRTMREIEIEEEQRAAQLGIRPRSVIIDFLQDRNSDLRRYNRPVTSEVAVVFQTDEDGEPPQNRDLRVYPRGNETRQISYMNGFLDPMVYPLFHVFGEEGWNGSLQQLDPNQNFRPAVPIRRVTQLQFYSYRLAIRPEQFNPFLRGSRLLQQYVVDVYVRAEANRLNFIKQNQSELLMESYRGLMDHINIVNNNRRQNPTGSTVPNPTVPNPTVPNPTVPNPTAQVGRMTILPSSFTGGPRYMQQNYQDAMAVVAKCGRPDLFITMTCNPNWREIRENLLRGQTAPDRPDIVTRVFKLKLDALLRDIQIGEIFGKVEALMYTVEFQKRGLPHAHILIILKHGYKILTTDIIDNVVVAELPNRQTHPILYNLVSSHMIHRPCGSENGNPASPCLNANICSKRYPKDFRVDTDQNVDGYPQYRRPNNGRHFWKSRKVGIGEVRIDNRWVVPYNPYLLYKFNCHINVEVCASVKSVKYIYKYIYKGYDAARINVRHERAQNVNGRREQAPNINGRREQEPDSRDEIGNYVNCRYVSPPEAMWRLNEFILHDRTHDIIRLAIHLKDAQGITFSRGQERQAIQRHKTTLTAWFDLNNEDPYANQFRYIDIPYHYVFQQQGKKWNRRRNQRKIIPRMYTVSPSEGERYFLRLLLLHVQGCKEHDDIRRVDGVLYETFQEAARARNLLDDDTELGRSLEEAATHQMPKQLRLMFAMLLVFALPSNPLELWETYKNALAEDYLNGNENTVAFHNTLFEINYTLKSHGKSNSDFNLPMPTAHNITSAVRYDPEEERRMADENLAQLRQMQRNAYDLIMESVESQDMLPKCFFLNAIAGSGKTYLFETLAHRMRAMEWTPIVVASTGIAALLLTGGRTAHSVFKIPVPAVENSTSSISINSQDAVIIRNAKLILWDEATMITGHVLRVVDRLLRFVKNVDVPFGGTTIVLAGDYRQTLPVVRRGDRTRIIQSTLKNSSLWPHFKVIVLNENIRVNPGETNFSNYVLSIGDGTVQTFGELGEDIIKIKRECVTSRDLVTEIFGTVINEINPYDLAKKVILCPKNDQTLAINNIVLSRMSGEERSYESADSIHNEAAEVDRTLYSTELLYSITPSGMPPHNLTLKVGSIVLLLRNLAVKEGLCNGTRLIVRNLMENLIIAEVITGSAQGKRVMIPRIIFDPSDIGLPFRFRRRQFPVRLGFAMTINKSQGQTFEKVGVYLKEPVFAHGQLYVAFSRVKSQQGLKVKVERTQLQGKLKHRCADTFTRNIVYREIFRDL